MEAKLSILTVYMISILLCRYAYRYAFKHDYWHSSSCGISILWFIPAFNTAAFIMLFIMVKWDTLRQKPSRNKITRWFTNQDITTK